MAISPGRLRFQVGAFVAFAAVQDSARTRPGAVVLDPHTVERWVDSLVEPA